VIVGNQGSVGDLPAVSTSAASIPAIQTPATSDAELAVLAAEAGLVEVADSGPVSVTDSLPDVNEQEAAELGVNLESFDSFTEQETAEFLTGEHGTVYGGPDGALLSKDADGTVLNGADVSGLKGGSTNFSWNDGSGLKGGSMFQNQFVFSFKNPPGLGLKGGMEQPESTTADVLDTKDDPIPAENHSTSLTPAVHQPNAPIPFQANGIDEQPVTVEVIDEPAWVDVAYTKNTSLTVKHYYNASEKLCLHKPDTDVVRDLEFVKKKVDLQAGTAYKFRVAAFNSCGRGPWSETSAFKTCLPGYPGAPCSIKISKATDGALISWEPPQNSYGDIYEYSVYLAVKPSSSSGPPQPGNLSFHRVYCGPSNQCTVPNQSLQSAQIDTSTKPAIIFRIAAKNEKGYGPATQVRWLQETAFPTFSVPKAGLKRTGEGKTANVKKPKVVE